LACTLADALASLSEPATCAYNEARAMPGFAAPLCGPLERDLRRAAKALSAAVPPPATKAKKGPAPSVAALAIAETAMKDYEEITRDSATLSGNNTGFIDFLEAVFRSLDVTAATNIMHDWLCRNRITTNSYFVTLYYC